MRKSAWLRLPIILLTTISLGACQAGHSSTVVKVICPTIRSYDQATLNRALAEYQRLPAGSAIKQMIGDYQVLRDRVRACRQQ